MRLGASVQPTISSQRTRADPNFKKMTMCVGCWMFTKKLCFS